MGSEIISGTKTCGDFYDVVVPFTEIEKKKKILGRLGGSVG